MTESASSAAQKSVTKDAGRRKLMLRVGVIIVLVLGTAEAIYWYRRIVADRRQADEEQRIAAIIAQAADSKDYTMGREQVAAGHFDIATLKRAFTDEIHRQMMKRVDGYFDLKTPQDRKEYLDRVIAETQAYDRLTASSRPASANAVNSQGSSQNKASFLNWVSQQPATSRARLAEFGAAMNGRLVQRGLPPMKGPIQ